MEQRGEPVKPLARTQEWNNLYRQPLQKNAAFTERTALRHLTPEEIALNQQELACSAEIEQLEMQETSLDYELERDIDENSQNDNSPNSAGSIQSVIDTVPRTGARQGCLDLVSTEKSKSIWRTLRTIKINQDRSLSLSLSLAAARS